MGHSRKGLRRRTRWRIETNALRRDVRANSKVRALDRLRGIGIYDRQGRQIDMLRYASMQHANGMFRREQRVAFTTVGNVDVSTVWLGIEHSSGLFFHDDKPRFFETVCFYAGLYSTEDVPREVPGLPGGRYSSEEEALEGHRLICENVAQSQRSDTCEYCGKPCPYTLLLCEECTMRERFERMVSDQPEVQA